MRLALTAAAGLLAYGAYEFWRRGDAAEFVSDAEQADFSGGSFFEKAADGLTGAAESAAEFIDRATGGLMKVSRMRNVNAAVLSNANLRAFLRVIRVGEGTADEAGYRRIFGGQLFESFADHPRVRITKSGITSTAAGAYQFLASTWDETKSMMGLSDFSPGSQDLGAVGRIAARGALEDVMAGRFALAVAKCAKEWASLPGSPYGQPTISHAKAAQIYAAAGGVSLDLTV